ncbi:MAG: MFS transporter [Corynebacterium sp.]|nr:MFS transporter [Corynebacterium sp.]
MKPETTTPHSVEKHNARRFIGANALQNLSDQLVAAKTVLPWLFQAAGVPAFFTGLLVPIRESGSMLPQSALTPWVVQHSRRRNLWVFGAVIQATAAAAMAAAAFVFSGTSLGVVVLALLAVLSLGRALCSITGKDIQGRTISKGSRGVVTGKATMWGGAAALVVGIGLMFLNDTLGASISVLSALLLLGAIAWALSGLVIWGVKEPESDKNAGRGKNQELTPWNLWRDDKQFRNFVIVRSLLLVSALSTSFIVVLAAEMGVGSLSGLAGFILASSTAGLVGGQVSGRLSDISSKQVMTWGAALASCTLIALVGAAYILPHPALAVVFPVAFFLVNLVHTGIRVARKTYVVDMASGDTRTAYVGAANTLMGVILLGVGAISAGFAQFGASVALLFLAAIGFIGVWRARSLADVSEPTSSHTFAASAPDNER